MDSRAVKLAAEAQKELSSSLSDRHALLVVFDVEDGRLELPGGNLVVEQNVDLTVRAVLELRKEEVGHHPADASGTSPDVTALACEIPSGRVEHLRGQIDHGDLRDIVGGTTDTGA
jgi:hypothetical protein